jgi:hypothetical protein
VEYFTKSKGNSWDMMSLTFHDKKESFTIQTNKIEGEWLVAMLKIAVVNTKVLTFQEIKADFESNLEDFELFWHSNQHFEGIWGAGSLISDIKVTLL